MKLLIPNKSIFYLTLVLFVSMFFLSKCLSKQYTANEIYQSPLDPPTNKISKINVGNFNLDKRHCIHSDFDYMKRQNRTYTHSATLIQVPNYTVSEIDLLSHTTFKDLILAFTCACLWTDKQQKHAPIKQYHIWTILQML